MRDGCSPERKKGGAGADCEARLGRLAPAAENERQQWQGLVAELYVQERHRDERYGGGGHGWRR